LFEIKINAIVATSCNWFLINQGNYSNM